MEKNEAYKFLEDDSKGFTKESAMAFLDGGVKPKGIITPKKEPVGHYEGWIKPTLDEYWKGVKATPETAAAIGTGVLAWGSSAITGVANIAAGKSGEETEKAMARTAETIQYQPKGEVAQQAAGMVGKGMEKALWPATMAKEQVARNKWGKKAEILTGLGSEIAMFWMAGKVGGKIKTHSKQRATSKAILDEKLSKLTSEQRTYVNEVAKEQIIHHQGEAPKLDQTFAAHEEGAKFAEGIKKDAETLTGQKALPEGKPQLPVKRGSVIELPHEVQLKDPKIIKPELQKKLPAPKGQKQLPPGQGFTMVSAKKFLEEKPKEPIKAEKPTVSETIKKAEDLSKQFKTKKDELTEILDGIQKRVSKKKVVPVKEAPVKGKEPWEMTLSEYESITGKPRKGATSYSGNTFHKNSVHTAINQGKAVPKEVLKDYPDLQKPKVEITGKKDKTVKVDIPKKVSKVRTMKGAIKEMGGIDFLNFKGELRDLTVFDRKAIAKKGGTKIDDAVIQLIDDGWLDKGTTVTNFLETLRTDAKKILGRDRITRDLSEKKNWEKSKAEKKFEKEMAHEPETPPKGEYKQLNAEDLPMGKNLTLLEGKSPNGWDVYKVVEKDPFSITIKDGKTIELKPFDKVEVLKKDLKDFKVRVKAKKEPPRYAQETLFGKDKTQIQPELPLKKKQNILKSQKGEVEIDIKAIKEGIKRVVEDLEESPTGKGIKEASKKLTGAAKETFRSPEDVYAPDPVGRKIYQRMDRADQRRNAFAAEQGELFKKAVGDIKGESISSKRIGMALDGKIPRSELTLKQRKAYDFFQEQYQFLIQKYARTAAGTEEGYLKVLKASNRKNPIQVKVSELSEPLQKKYGVLKNRLDKIRKGRALKDLGADEKVYWDTRKEMLRTLNKGWTEKLTAGERKAFDVLSRRIKDYLPHMFERTELLADFKTEISTINSKLRTATNKGAITQYKNRLKQLEDAVIRLEKGYMVTFESLPQNVRFKYFESRKGKAGYSFDAIKAYQSYLDGITKKIYIEPAIKEVAQLHKELSPELKSYNKTFIRKYMGWDVSKWDSAAGAIASAQWMRTLGLNPRSAIVNLTQRMNTIVEVGERQALGRPILSALHLKKGEILGYTKEGTKLFDATGISKEIPQVLMEGAIPKSMESMKNVLGYMFHKIEIGNRKHAFLSGYSLAKSGKISPQMAKRYDIKNPKKMTEAECVQFGVDVAHKTQFRYGKIGMPMGLRHPVGRLALQYWSYPIKQTEYMVGLLKSDPKKLIKLIAYAEGSKYVLDEFLNTDLSNALGFGITWGEIIKAAQAVPEGDWRKFLRHAKLTFGGGGGVLPSGLGPTATGASKVAASIRKGRGFQTLKRELTPVQWKRFSQAYDALKNRKGNKYPIYDSRKHLMYYVTSKELAMRTVGPRPAKESKQWIEYQKGQLLEQERGEVLQDIINAMVDGNSKKANKLMNRYQIEPTDQAIEAEILKRKLTRKERKSLKDFGKPEEYQYQREGKTY